MISYLPELYEDELVYSWFARFFAHMYPSYTCALEDLLENRNMRADVEFLNRLNAGAITAITKVISLEELVLKHTMFPYCRFAETSRLCNALQSMVAMEGDVHQLLPLSKGHPAMNARFIKYCPVCASEARNTYGEAYWSRKAIMRNVNICTEHKCRLKSTGIAISGKQSPRLYVAEEEISDMSIEPVAEGLELSFSEFMVEVFSKPINLENDVHIGDFLKSRLAGTKYMSARGMQMNMSLLVDDLKEFYKDLQQQDTPNIDMAGESAFSLGITQRHQIQHILTGKCADFYRICQIAFFLGISSDDLTNPEIPKMTQTMKFDAKVVELYAQGLGCYRIARELGCSASTVRHVNKPKEKKPHDYSAARLGKQARDWEQYDIDMLPEVQKVVGQIYGSDGQRPKRVTEFAVIKCLGWPSKRFDYMPKCRELVQRYYEEFPVYWAREIVWCYELLKQNKEESDILWRDMRDVTNLRKDNFIASFPYLTMFTDKHTVDRIKNLI